MLYIVWACYWQADRSYPWASSPKPGLGHQWDLEQSAVWQHSTNATCMTSQMCVDGPNLGNSHTNQCHKCLYHQGLGIVRPSNKLEAVLLMFIPTPWCRERSYCCVKQNNKICPPTAPFYLCWWTVLHSICAVVPDTAHLLTCRMEELHELNNICGPQTLPCCCLWQEPLKKWN